MTGGVRKRGSTWSYYFDLGTIDGKRKKKEKGGFRTKKEAEAALAKAINELNTTGQVFEASSITVAEYFDYWYDNYCSMNLKLGTMRQYRMTIDNHIKPSLGQYRLKALQPAVLQQYINDLKKQGYSQKTVAQIRDTISSALSYAVQPMQYIQFNPCQQIKLPKFEKQESKRYLITPDDFQRIIEAFPPGTPYYLPLMIGYYTGLRVNECCALTWDDIDLENHMISVNKTLLKLKRQNPDDSIWHFNEPKSETSRRTVLFGDTLYYALAAAKEQKQISRQEHGGEFIECYYRELKFSNGYTDLQLVSHKVSEECKLPIADMVCVRDNGSYITSDPIQDSVQRTINQKLEIPFNFHSLRHSHATYLIENGASVKDVQERLGHANTAITMNIYVHNTDSKRQETVDIFEKAVDKSRK